MTSAPVDAGASVVLVDARGRATGRAPKLDAHRPPGLRHRAVSVFVLDGDDGIFLQRRSETKYHFAGLWSNSCCTHPGPDESVVEAGERRLVEELGVRGGLREIGVFSYRAEDPSTGLVEDEFDHVLVGRTSDAPAPDPLEVAQVAVVSLDTLEADLRSAPERFSPWLAPAVSLLRGVWPLERPFEAERP